MSPTAGQKSTSLLESTTKFTIISPERLPKNAPPPGRRFLGIGTGSGFSPGPAGQGMVALTCPVTLCRSGLQDPALFKNPAGLPCPALKSGRCRPFSCVPSGSQKGGDVGVSQQGCAVLPLQVSTARHILPPLTTPLLSSLFPCSVLKVTFFFVSLDLSLELCPRKIPCRELVCVIKGWLHTANTANNRTISDKRGNARFGRAGQDSRARPCYKAGQG